MKITVELEDGKKEVYQNVADAYLCVRQMEPVKNKKGKMASLPETKSYSWGSNVRELVKELNQSVFELQDYLRNLINANSK